jgi:ankyrin repeat protein
MPVANSSPYGHFKASTFVRERLLQGCCGRTINARESFFNLAPIHYAVGNYDLDMAKLLIQCGADINARATKERRSIAMIKLGALTPLDLALSYGDAEMADLIKKNGGMKDSEFKKD